GGNPGRIAGNADQPMFSASHGGGKSWEKWEVLWICSKGPPTVPGRLGMAGRVALVTGGTRGIGAAISRMLKLRGYQVAANYAGNDVAANAFKEETGIPVYKFDVSDFEAVKAAVTKIEQELGPIEIVVNNAGI